MFQTKVLISSIQTPVTYVEFFFWFLISYSVKYKSFSKLKTHENQFYDF